jgi:hypothetical protein
MSLQAIQSKGFRGFFLAMLSLAGSLFSGCVDSEFESYNISQLYRDSGSIDTNEFHLASHLDQDIRPSIPVIYWEERIVYDSGNTRVGMASSDSCAHRSDPCVSPIQAYRSYDGEQFGFPTLFDHYKRYFVGWTGKQVIVWNGQRALKDFILPIDSEGDAILWAGHHQYASSQFSNPNSTSPFWIRTNDQGFELIGERMASMCHPITLVQVRFVISRNGDIRERARKTLKNDEKNCLQN